MIKRNLMITILFIATALSFSAVSQHVFGHGKEKHVSPSPLHEITYNKDIKPLFDKKCSKCHGAKSPVHMDFIKDIQKYKRKMKGPRMNTYSHMVSFVVWPDTASLMRALDDGRFTESEKPGKMYRHLGTSEQERQKNLKLFKAWISNWTLNDWDNITKEEINRMKLFY